MNPVLAVVIATKNRAGAIQQYALPSLALSEFREFVCVVWDASGDGLTQIAAGREWGFETVYRKAPRTGSSSQRNDAVRWVLDTYPDMRYIVFMDDDSSLSRDALDGILASFRENSGARIVNLRMNSAAPPSFRSKFARQLRCFFGLNRHGATPFLYNYGGGEDEIPGGDADWANTGGMGVDTSVFRDLRVFFPEEFQRFGGYALGEDFAFSFYASRKGGGRVVNGLFGHFTHYAAGSARLDVKNMAAAKWYNFHLLFDALYDGARGPKLWGLKARFKLFMCAAALKLLFRAKSWDIFAVLRGIAGARTALRRYRETHEPQDLMKR